MTAPTVSQIVAPAPAPAGRLTLPRVLCVDDDERLLAGLALRLRRGFEVVTATSAADALARLELSHPFAVVVSDMRMPQVDGATFLSAIRRVAPETVRILLTGQADAASAIAAVNHGEVFRYLLKPIETPALIAALDEAVIRHDAVVAQRKNTPELLLRGVAELLMLPLATAAPDIAGECTRIRQIVADVTGVVAPSKLWLTELATVMLHLTLLEISPEVAVRWRSRVPLTVAERGQVDLAIQRAVAALQKVRDTEEACEALTTLLPLEERDASWRVPAKAGIVARILHVVMAFEALRIKGQSAAKAMIHLRHNAPESDAALLDALSGARLQERNAGIPLSEVEVGHRTVNEVRLASGVLLLPACHDVSAATLELIAGLDAEAQRTVVYVVETPSQTS